MTKEELFKEAVEVTFDTLEDVPLLSGIYIVQQKKLHDSGYRMMYVIGHTEDFDYYLLGRCSDVVDFESFFTKVFMEDLHLDINKHGVIHIWSKRNKFRCTHFLSNCVFETIK